MILAAGGYVSPEAEAALTAALQRDPQNGMARYLCRADVRCKAGGPTGPSRSGRRCSTARRRLTPGSRRSGRRSRGSRPKPGRSAMSCPRRRAPGRRRRAWTAAAEMTPEERQAMIEGMVAQLSRAAGDRGRAGRGLGAADPVAWRAGRDRPRAQPIWTEAQAALRGRAGGACRSCGRRRKGRGGRVIVPTIEDFAAALPPSRARWPGWISATRPSASRCRTCAGRWRRRSR